MKLEVTLVILGKIVMFCIYILSYLSTHFIFILFYFIFYLFLFTYLFIYLLLLFFFLGETSTI